MNALLKDDSPAAQARAAVTYNMIVEGVLAETGYYGIHRSIEERGILPGFVEGMRLVKRDESRHIRYGVYLLQRLISEDPAVWDVMQSRMNELFPTAMALIPEYWEAEGYMSDEGPMGVRMSELVAYAGSQFDTRMRILERDRGKTLREIERAVTRDMEEEEVEAAAR
jgi:ribonucleoside-diphosphate reductase beta chain